MAVTNDENEEVEDHPGIAALADTQESTSG